MIRPTGAESVFVEEMPAVRAFDEFGLFQEPATTQAHRGEMTGWITHVPSVMA